MRVAATGGGPRALLRPRARRVQRRPEQALQIHVVNTLRVIAPRLLFWFCPNGGNLSKAQRGRFKAMGLRAGVSDLHFVLPGGRLGVIELKADKGSASDDQEAFLAQCEAQGVPWAICRSVDEVLNTLKSWGVPMRGVLT